MLSLVQNRVCTMKRKYIYISVIVFFLTFFLTDYFINPGYSVKAPELIINLELNGGKILSENSNYLIEGDLYLPYNSSNSEKLNLPEVYKNGFFLEGWYADSKLTRPVSIDNTTPSLDQFDLKEEGVDYTTTIYAKWTCMRAIGGSRTVYFETNGGSKINEISECTTCTPSPESELPRPTRSGYSFVGWYSDKALTKRASKISDANFEQEYYDAEKTCPTNSSYGTLYAKWEKNQTDCPIISGGSKTIYFESNGGDKIDAISYCTVCSEESLKLPTPARAGYVFKGWYADKALTKKLNITTTHSSDLSKLETILEYYDNAKQCPTNNSHTTVYAKWEKESCPKITGGIIEISFNTNGGTAVDKLSICPTCSEEKVKLPIPSKAGYVFAGWYAEPEFINIVEIDSSTSSNLSKLNSVQDIDENGCSKNTSKATLYARYYRYAEYNKVTIRFIDNENEEVVVYEQKNEDNKLPIPEKEGYNFVGWYIDENYTHKIEYYDEISDAIFDNELDSDELTTNLYAKWEKIEENLVEESSSKYKNIIILTIVGVVVVGVIILYIYNKIKKNKANLSEK